MQAKKIVIAASAVALLAAGCSKGGGTAQTKDTGPTPMTADAASQVLSGTVAPVGWIPFEAEGYTFSMPLSWYAQEVAGAEGQLVVSNTLDISATATGSTQLRISRGVKTAEKTLASVATSLVASKAGTTKAVEGVTNSGLRTATVTFTENKNTVKLVVIQKGDTDYIVMQASGNIQDPFVDQIINSTALRAL